LEIWAGPLAPWELRGSEHAAETISWALFDRELDLVTIPNAGPAAIEASYRILTGRSLPDRESKGHRAVQAPPFWRAWAIPTSSPWPPGAGSPLQLLGSP
jgi:hypothetical protein